jgi:hypothetical protein
MPTKKELMNDFVAKFESSTKASIGKNYNKYHAIWDLYKSHKVLSDAKDLKAAISHMQTGLTKYQQKKNKKASIAQTHHIFQTGTVCFYFEIENVKTKVQIKRGQLIPVSCKSTSEIPSAFIRSAEDEDDFYELQNKVIKCDQLGEFRQYCEHVAQSGIP